MRRVGISKLTNFSFLPSLFSLLSLFAGYLSMNQIFKGNFVNAVYLIMASVVLDGFDGTIARLTKTDSHFGTQLDSLIDAVVFGAVTSLLIYRWGFSGELLHFGKIIGFIFLSAGVIRLARFNVMKEAEITPSNIFVGLPIPGGSVSIGSAILLIKQPLKDEKDMLLFSFFVIIISFLMISNVKYKTFKKINSKNGLKILFMIAVILAFIIIYPTKSVPIVVILYLFSPLFFLILSKVKKQGKRYSSRRSSSEESK